MLFASREEAGQKLGVELLHYLKNPDVVVVGILRGGAVVARNLAKKLSVNWDVLGIKKIGAPFDPELAVGAVAPDGSVSVVREVKNAYQISDEYIEEARKHKFVELRRQLELVRGSLDYSNLENQIVVLTDDGVATGATVSAAVKFLRKKGVKQLVLAVPVISREAKEMIAPTVDELVALECPKEFFAVGEFYGNFDQVSDAEVKKMLMNRGTK